MTINTVLVAETAFEISNTLLIIQICLDTTAFLPELKRECFPNASDRTVNIRKVKSNVCSIIYLKEMIVSGLE